MANLDQIIDNLSDLGNLKFGTYETVNTTSQYTVPTTGVLTGNARHASNTTVGYLGIRSSFIGGYRYFESSDISGGYMSVNMLVVKGEVLTFESGQIQSTDIRFLPLERTSN
ncbi:MAG: hypothetical protein IIZ78_08790 [Clostridiales bacterium]|nr:hypothetical protein [Clostridiales bacterium]